MDKDPDYLIKAVWDQHWKHVRALPVLTVRDLCRLSVGLELDRASDVLPNFAVSQPARLTAQCAPVDLAKRERQAKRKLDELLLQRKFKRRAHIATANLAPLGKLLWVKNAMAGRIAAGELTMVRAPDFAAWADDMGWTLPDEFPRTRTAEDKPMKTTEKNTLLVIIAALCKNAGIDHNAKGASTKIVNMTVNLGTSVSDDTVRRMLKQIPDALETRMK